MHKGNLKCHSMQSCSDKLSPCLLAVDLVGSTEKDEDLDEQFVVIVNTEFISKAKGWTKFKSNTQLWNLCSWGYLKITRFVVSTCNSHRLMIWWTFIAADHIVNTNEWKCFFFCCSCWEIEIKIIMSGLKNHIFVYMSVCPVLHMMLRCANKIIINASMCRNWNNNNNLRQSPPYTAPISIRVVVQS